MNYCSIEEAWGSNNLKDCRKKKKTKRLYTTNIPPHIYDNSYIDGDHDEHCSENKTRNYTVKNKNRFNKSRGQKDIYRPKRSSRVSNINLSYDEAKKEYKNFKKENKRNSKQKMSSQEISVSENYPMNANEIDLFNEDNLSYSPLPIQDDDYENTLPNGNNLSSNYQVRDDERIKNKMFKLQQEQSQVLKEQRQMVENQMENQGLTDNIENFDDYYANNNIEPFEGGDNNLDQLNIEQNDEEERMNQINDIGNEPSPSSTQQNYIDNRINNNDDSDTESDDENKLEIIDNNSSDMEYRLNTLNRNVNLIIKKMNESNLLDEDSQDNIHDLILFILFGVFIIFVLDTIYRFGKKSQN
tara:strand:+ start:48 stop:1115 length:1068 start_codon:yes stop_codon:yes gene_type:complete